MPKPPADLAHYVGKSGLVVLTGQGPIRGVIEWDGDTFRFRVAGYREPMYLAQTMLPYVVRGERFPS